MNQLRNYGGSTSRWRMMPMLAILALTVVGIGAGSASAATAVPFKASVSGTLTPAVGAAFTLDGTGKASHLGNLKDYTAGGVVMTGTVGVNDLTDTLTETLTAANGDTLTILCTQTAALSAGVYRGTDTWTVIGGTGRFAGATGSGSGETVFTLSSNTFTKTMTGSISY